MKIKEIIGVTPSKEYESITLKGWVRTTRHYKKVSFVELYDGSCFDSIQVVFSDTDIKHISTGCAIEVTGDLIESQGQGQDLEIKGTEVKVLAECDPETYPIQKKEHSMEFFREQQHLRLRTKLFQAIMRVRSGLSHVVDTFFMEQDFIKFHTPIISHTDCEGGGETFELKDEEFFGKKSHLTISGQIEGEYGALALGKIYTFGPTFRAEDSHTTKHLAEFWMIEPEMSFYSMEDTIKLATEFLKYCVSETKSKYSKELEFLYTQDSELEERLEYAEKDFVQIKYTEAIELCSLSYGDDIGSEYEKMLIEHFQAPVIVTHFPKK